MIVLLQLYRLPCRVDSPMKLQNRLQINGGNVYQSPFTLKGYPAAAPYGPRIFLLPLMRVVTCVMRSGAWAHVDD